MAGVALKNLGHHVRIFERYPATRMEGQGAGITAQTDVQHFFMECGLSEPPYSVHSPNLQILKRNGSVKSTWNLEFENTSWNTLYYRLRAAFDGQLSEYCRQAPDIQQGKGGNGVYEHGKTVTNVKFNDQGATVYFEDIDGGQGSATADLVIAADGTFTILAHERKYSGSYARVRRPARRYYHKCWSDYHPCSVPGERVIDKTNDRCKFKYP